MIRSFNMSTLVLTFSLSSDILLGEVEEGMGMVGEVLDTPPVEVEKPNKGLELLLIPCHSAALCQKPWLGPSLPPFLTQSPQGTLSMSTQAHTFLA